MALQEAGVKTSSVMRYENVPCLPRALLRVYNAFNNGWLITGMIHALVIKYALISGYTPINQTLRYTHDIHVCTHYAQIA